MTPFDIFLPCAPKDYNKLPYVIDAIVRNGEGFRDIWICAPIIPDCLEKSPTMPGSPFHFVKDNDALHCDRSKWRYRPNWTFQQHLKLFQNVTSDWYVTVDCDTIINRPVKFWEGEKPVWYKGWSQVYQPYFDFNKKILDLDRIETRTFIADMNFFYRPFVLEMLARGGYTIESFITKSQEITDDKCHMAEPELYGQYCLRHHPDFYVFRDLKQTFQAKFQKECEGSVWSNADIEGLINHYRNADLDTFALHSWYTGE